MSSSMEIVTTVIIGIVAVFVIRSFAENDDDDDF